MKISFNLLQVTWYWDWITSSVIAIFSIKAVSWSSKDNSDSKDVFLSLTTLSSIASGRELFKENISKKKKRKWND